MIDYTLAACYISPIHIDSLLVGAGVVTALPLIAFAFGARRLSLVTLGVLQYVAPSCMFLLGVFVYGESFSPAHRTTFLLIWAGLALYSAEGALRLRRAAHGLRLDGQPRPS